MPRRVTASAEWSRVLYTESDGSVHDDWRPVPLELADFVRALIGPEESCELCICHETRESPCPENVHPNEWDSSAQTVCTNVYFAVDGQSKVWLNGSMWELANRIFEHYVELIESAN